MSVLLDVDHIRKQYGNFVAVDDVSFQVRAGNIYGILGPNGAGKTTTIRMIMNILVPDSGNIKLFDQSMNEGLKSRIGYLPEERGLYRKMKVTDMLVFLGELHGMDASGAREKAAYWLDKLGLLEDANHRVDELSKGMQQKIQIIGTIMHGPDLIILDEPFSGLDPVNVNLVKDIMLDLKSAGKAIMLSTHMMDTAEKLCDEVLMINKGSKVLDGQIDEVLSQYGKKTVHLEYAGENGFFKDCQMIAKYNIYPNYAEIELKDNYRPNDLLKELIDKVEINSLRSMRSSLNEIFIALAGENNHG